MYTCPLCYSEMHRRVYKSYRIKSDDEPDGNGGDDDDDDDDDSRAPSENVYDPMLVLGWLDNEKFQGASAFCFTKLAKVKEHLRDDHNIDTRGLEGNDLYKRYRVRAADGILQRFLKQSRRGFGSFQGDMRRYWNEGNNQTFVYLLDLMQRALYYTQTLEDNDADEDDKESAEEYLSIGRRFFESFIDRAADEWKRTSSPFQKTGKEDLKDFLVADDDVEEEDGEENAVPAFLAHREVMRPGEESDENDLVHKLQRKYADNNGDEPSSDDELSDANSENSPGAHTDDDDDAKQVFSDVSDINGYYSEPEEDEWVSSIQKKRKAKGKHESVADDVKTPTPSGKKLTKRKSSPSSATPPSAGIQATPASRRKSILEDSDDEA
jgi:hypothetical protein